MIEGWLLLKCLVVLPFFVYASLSDVRTTFVSNKIWGLLLWLSIPFIGVDLWFGGFLYLGWLLLSFFLMLFGMYLLFRFRVFGGADAKAFIVLGVWFPVGLVAAQAFINLLVLSFAFAPYLLLRRLRDKEFRILAHRMPYLPLVTLSWLLAVFYGCVLEVFL